MSDATRDRLLRAARDVFARHGYAGATTRRIAQLAEVHEVTMFRLFGSKDALLDEAIRVAATGEHAVPLPEAPVSPGRELTMWCTAEIRRLAESRAVILQCLADEATHPELAEAGASPLEASAAELNRYVARLETGQPVSEAERKAAVTMLLAALYSDALGRNALPGVHRLEISEAPALYVKVFLRALGVDANR